MKSSVILLVRLRLCLILLLTVVCPLAGRAQADTLRLYYHYSQITPTDSTLRRIDEWIKSLNGRHIQLNVFAYYDKQEFKKFGVSRLDELFLVLNRKARSLFTIAVMEARRGKVSQRSCVDIVYTFTDGQPSPLARKPLSKPETANAVTSDASPKIRKLFADIHHNAKINVVQIGLLNISGQYECVIHKKLSLALGLSYLVPRQIKSFVNMFSAETAERAQGRQIGFISPVISGWAVTSELRLYPFARDGRMAPAGFYIAPYFRYSKLSMVSQYNEYYDGVYYALNFTSSYRCVSGGVMIGKQWLAGKRKRVTIDWWIVGVGGGIVTPKMEASATNINMDAKVQADVKKEVENDLVGFKRVGFKDPQVSTTSNSFTANIGKAPFFVPRGLGLCLGFLF